MVAGIAVARSTVTWSRWFRCRAGFDLSLVPVSGGIYAIAQEQAGAQISILRIEAADDLFQALTQVFEHKSPLREQFATSRCLVRYAAINSSTTRAETLTALQTWLEKGVSSPAVEHFLGAGGEHPFRDKSD